MESNLNKYDNIIFHDDDDINDKIKAYMLIFDYQFSSKDLSIHEKIDSLNKWEEDFLAEEFYEIIPCLIHRRRKLEIKVRYDNMSVIDRMAYKLSDIIESLGNKKK